MFLNNGFDDFVAKPVQGKDFGECLLRHLSKDLIQRTDSSEESDGLPEDFPSYNKERIDIESAVDMAGGLENYLTVAKTFYHSITSNSSEIENFLASQDLKNYTIQVHALKSSARIIGMSDLSKKAEYLEMLGKKLQQSEDSVAKEKITKYTPLLLKQYRSYMTDLKPVIDYAEQKSCSAHTTVLSNEELNDILVRISDAAKNCDLDTVEQEFEAIKNSILPDTIADSIKELESAIENIDLDAIAEISNRAIKSLG